ncbi:LysR family transcriptional regulator [Thermomonospora umbrina]|uniref:LysR family transcriptional regulator n=1 Tax=Thermomonospora umbrina TaxID=111806 RepID=UPI000E23C74B|nr:LysR substrate-binding domain-containing protein [Thermomonospora umbrina]
MLDLNRARILREVARSGSMTAAARALSYTQPAVSHHIARLEREVGTPLVVRHGRGVRLTEAGRVLVGHVEAVLARLADAEEEIAAIAGLRAGRVRAAVFPTAAAGLLPDALAALRVRAPRVTVSLVEAEPPEALAALRAGEVDVAVVFSHDGGPGDGVGGVREVPLLEDPVLLAVPAGHAAAGAGVPRLADLAEETWASGCERCRGHLVRACGAAGFAPRIAYATDDHVAVQRLVDRGLAVTALPAMAFAVHREPGVVVMSSPELGGRRVAALVPSGARPPAVAAFLDELSAVSAGWAAAGGPARHGGSPASPSP